MKSKKFPVTDNNGKSYLVTVKYEWYFGNEILNVDIFEKKELNFKFFKFKKNEWKYGYRYYKNDENGNTQYYNDVLLAVKNTFNNYESDKIKLKLDKFKIESEINKFEEWDGKL